MNYFFFTKIVHSKVKMLLFAFVLIFSALSPTIMVTQDTFAQSQSGPADGNTDGGGTAPPANSRVIADIQAEEFGNLSQKGGQIDLGSLKLCQYLKPITWMTTCPAYFFSKIGILTLELGSKTLDFMLPFALETKFLDGNVDSGKGVENLWSQFRGIANIFFMVGIVWISILMISGSNQYRRLLMRLIIIAFVINFSLFVTRVIVDAGTVTAYILYNSVEITNAKPVVLPTYLEEGVSDKTLVDGGVKSITGGIINVLNPAKFFGSESLTVLATEGASTANGDNEKFVRMAILLLLIGGTTFFIGKEFAKVAIAMISRSFLIILYAVISPLAFASYFIPGADKYIKKWFIGLLQASFCVTIYMLFIYFTYVIVVGVGGEGETAKGIFSFADVSNRASGGTGVTETLDFSEFIIFTALQYAIVIVLLNIGSKYAKQWCDQLGLGESVWKFASGSVRKAMGGAAILATGGAAFAARGTLGRLANRRLANNGDNLRNAQKTGGISGALATAQLYTFDKLQSTKFGLKEGYKERRDRAGDNEMKLARNMENSIKDNYASEKKQLGDDKWKSKYGEGATPSKMAKAETKEYLGDRKNNLLSLAFNGGVNGNNEVYNRYARNLRGDAQKKENTTIIKDITKGMQEDNKEEIKKMEAEGDNKQSSLKSETSKVSASVENTVKADGVVSADMTVADVVSSDVINNIKGKMESPEQIGNFEKGIQGQIDLYAGGIEGMREELEELVELQKEENGKLDSYARVSDKINSPEGLSSVKKSDFNGNEELINDLGIEFDEAGSISNADSLSQDQIRSMVIDKESEFKDSNRKLKSKIDSKKNDLAKKEGDFEKALKKEVSSLENSNQKKINATISDKKAELKESLDSMRTKLNSQSEAANDEITSMQSFEGNYEDHNTFEEGSLNLTDAQVKILEKQRARK